jgi:tRNA(Ile)-lysidine synthase
VHVDHGLRPGSGAEADVVARAAARFGAAFESATLELIDGPNLEARARTARHRALGPDAATGHTADDQAETVLANLLRGAGVDGMAGMRAGARHPILALRRSETAALCARLGLEPVADPSNDDPRFLRNRIRHELLPLCSALAGRDLVPVLARQAELLAGDADVLAALAELVDPTDGRALVDVPGPIGRRAVRQWLRGDAEHPPSLAAVERVLDVARGRARATELPGGQRVNRSGGRLSMAPRPVPVQSPRVRSRKG